jgi:phosphatidylinositol alpha-mannosyltransferase
MRILLVCPYDWHAPGGVQVHVRQLGSALRARRHEVVILAPGDVPATEPWVRIVGRPIRVPYAGTVAPISFSPAAWSRVRGRLRAFAPDIVHVHEPLTPSVSMLATLAADGPVVATFHAYLERSRLMRLGGPVLRRVHRRIDVSIAVSEAAAGFLRRVISGPIVIVPNGVDLDRFADPGPPAEGLPVGRLILWVSRLDPQKGFGVMVRAFEDLARGRPEAFLVVAGDGRDRQALERLSDGARRRVVHLGTVPHQDLPRYHAAADVFVAAATGQESFGIVLVEAMAAGVPVVATDISGYREVVRAGVDGLLVPPEDPTALARAVGRVLDEPDLALALAEAGRERARSFSWSQVVPRLEAAYEGAIAAAR